MLNHIVIMGRLVRDPELRQTPQKIPVASFTLAVDRDYAPRGANRDSKETDFIDCVAWRHNAEFVSKYFTKGRTAVVDGRLQIRNWIDKEGNKRRTAEVVADHVYFGDSKRTDDNRNHVPASYAEAPNNSSSYAPSAASASDFALLEDDDAQLPF